MFKQEALTAAAKKTELAKETNGKAILASKDQGAIAKAFTTGNKKQKEGKSNKDKLAFYAFEVINALKIYKQGKKANV